MYTIKYNGKDLDTIIQSDDNIGLALKKISYATGTPWTDLYAYYKRRIAPVQRDVVIQLFVKNVFRGEKRIPMSRLSEAAHNFFGKSLSDLEDDYNVIDLPRALEIIRERMDKVTTVIEPLGFHYVYNGYLEYVSYSPDTPNEQLGGVINNELAMTLQSYDIYKNVVYVVSRSTKTNSHLFPFPKESGGDVKKLIKELIAIEETVQNVPIDDMKEQGFLNFMHVHIDNINSRQIDLLRVFEHLHVTGFCPFIKLKLKTNAFYKIHESFVERLVSDKELYRKLVGVANDAEYILFKMVLANESLASIVLHDNGMMDLRMNFTMRSKETKDSVSKYITDINAKIIDEISKASRNVMSRIPNDVLDNRYDDCYVVKTVMYGSITSDNFQFKFGNFVNIVKSKLYPYLEVIPNPDKNVIHLLYKKVDNYAEYDNIKDFISRNYGAGREELVKRIVETFTLTQAEAEQQVDRWNTSNEVELVHQTGDKSYFKPKHDTFVNIKVRVNSTLDMRYMITGVKHSGTYDRLVWLLKKLAKMSHNKYKEKDTAFLKSYDAMLTGEKGLTFADVIVDEEAADFVEDDIDDDLLALEAEFAEAEPIIEPEPVIEDSKPKRRKGELLKKLHDADPNLFVYKVSKTEKRRDYASLCGSVGMRQPVVVTKNELDRISPGAIEGYVKTGSTKELAQKNYYICPSIWCPKSRAAITYDEYTSAGNKCPGNFDEEPVLFQSTSFWGVGEAALKRKRYPSFLDMYTHPDKLCLPCCYKTAPSSGNRNKQRQEVCVSNYKDEVVPDADGDVVGNERYIKGETFSPLDVGRYGLIPSDMHNSLGNSVCGSRHDGTGILKNNAKCFLRRGIAHGKQSFLSCVGFSLGISNVKDVIVKNLDIETYIGLESGRLLKLFIDETIDSRDEAVYAEFLKWLKTQKSYVSKYNLTKLLDTDNPRRKALLREFLIWGSFKNFIKFLNDDTIEKDHMTLIDLINLAPWLNPKKIYFVVLEFDPATGKTYMLCPSRQVDRIDNAALLVRRNGYYEPVVRIDNITAKGVIEDVVYPLNQELISFFVTNCKAKDQSNKKNIKAFLESQGHDVRSMVIDYDFKVCGVLLKNNLYIPMFDKGDILDYGRDRFVYYDEVPLFKCSLTKREVSGIFKAVQSYTKDARYEISHWIQGMNGLLINYGSTLIPLMLDNKSKAFNRFSDDLDIFIGDDDVIHQMSQKLQDALALEQNSDIKQELMFVMDSGHIIPWEYRAKKLNGLLNKLRLRIPEDVIVSVTQKVVQRLTVNTSRFNTNKGEYVLSYRDVKMGKIHELWELQKNPFKHISDMLYNMEVHSYSLENTETRTIELPPHSYQDVPVKYRKKLKGFVVASVDEYMRDTLMQIFRVLSKDRMDMIVFESNIKKSIMQDWKDNRNALNEFATNPSYVAIWKKEKAVGTLDSYLESLDHLNYFQSFYEAKVLSMVCNINLITIGHTTLKNPDGFKVFVVDNSPKAEYLMLLHTFDRFNSRDRFDVITLKNKRDIIFQRSEIPAEFMDMIDKKSKGEIEIEV